jgi:hypothetical protein
VCGSGCAALPLARTEVVLLLPLAAGGDLDEAAGGVTLDLIPACPRTGRKPAQYHTRNLSIANLGVQLHVQLKKPLPAQLHAGRLKGRLICSALATTLDITWGDIGGCSRELHREHPLRFRSERV